MSIRDRQLMEPDENLLTICLALHMSVHGSSDPLPQDVHERYVLTLKDAFYTWEAGREASKDFDDAVLDLIMATLSEVREKEKDDRERSPFPVEGF